MSSFNQSKEKVLLTGAAGFLGRAIAQALGNEFEVIALDVTRPAPEHTGSDFIACDLTNDASVREAMKTLRQRHGSRLASVVHLAAHYDFSGEESPLYEELTVEGTRRLLRELQEFDVEQFVFSSSLLVMRPAEDGTRLTEQSRTQAEWAYPRSKLGAEQVVAQSRGHIPAVVLRIAGVYDEDCHSIPIAQQIRRIHETELESFFFPGRLDHGQSFVHQADLAECVVRTVMHRHSLAPYETFLIGEADVMTYQELQEEVGRTLHGVAWPTLRVPKPLAKAGAWAEDKLAPEGKKPFIQPWMIDMADARYPIDPSKAATKLGWRPRHTLRSTLGEMLRRLQCDPERWYTVNKLPLPAELRTSQ